MNNVISIHDARTLQAERAMALLGRAPILTFMPDERDECCLSVRLAPAGRDVWVGLVGDKAILTERIRMGARPRFLTHHEGSTPTVCGDTEARVVGRVTSDGTLEGDLTGGVRAAALGLLDGQAFQPQSLAVIEFRLDGVRIDEGEGPSHGAIPRT
jgi:hypothetical protein